MARKNDVDQVKEKSGSRKRGGLGVEPKYVLGDNMTRQGHVSASETLRGGYMKWLGGAC